MNNGCQIDTCHIEIRNVLLRIAHEKGWNCIATTATSGEYTRWLIAYPDEGKVRYNPSVQKRHQTVSICEFIELLEKGPVPKVRFRIKDEGSSIPLSFHGISDGEVYVKAGGYIVIRFRNDGTFHRGRSVSNKLGLQLDSLGRIKEYVDED